jgi:RimJ/RimL family protein N-acetyltransferase
VIDYTQNPAYLAVAERILGQKFDPRTVVTLTSKDQNDNILGVVVFSRFTTGTCEISVAAQSPRFISKTFAYAVAVYPFIQLGYKRVTAIVAVDNSASLNLAQRLGFKMEGRLRDWFPNSDAFILGLLRDDCKWLKDVHGLPFGTSHT